MFFYASVLMCSSFTSGLSVFLLINIVEQDSRQLNHTARWNVYCRTSLYNSEFVLSVRQMVAILDIIESDCHFVLDIYSYFSVTLATSDVGPWHWCIESLALQSKSLTLALRVVLGLECLVWLCIWYKLQVTNSLLHWCDGVCWQWQYVPAHGNGIIYLPSQQCF